MNMRKIFIPSIVLLLQGTCGLQGCNSPEPVTERHEFSRLRMGSRTNLTLYAPAEQVAMEAADAAFIRIAELEDAISDWQVDSEVARLRAIPPGQRIAISDDLDGVLAASLEVSRESGGAFDVSCGALTRLWRNARTRNTPPGQNAIDQAVARSGWQSLQRGVDSSGPFLVIDREGLELDFGGIGKGYAADVALETLKEHGISSAMVELGGDMALGAPPPGRAGWRISGPGWHDPLVLSNCGVATSGATEQFLEVDGARLSHLLDPRTGQAIPDHGVVTVVAPSALEADAWASVGVVLGVASARTAAGPGIQFLSLPGPGKATATD